MEKIENYRDTNQSGEKGALLVGIDEAGYGPVLGPLVITATVFEVPRRSLPIDFWDKLHDVPVNRPGKGARTSLSVGDSKQLYSSGKKLDRLENAVFSFARLAGLPERICMTEFLDTFVSEDYKPPENCPWYEEDDTLLPIDMEELPFLDALQHRLNANGLSFKGFLIRPVFEWEFNHLVEFHGNKSFALFELTASLADRLMKRFSEVDEVHIYYDKQGGRNFYSSLLIEKWPEYGFLVEKESRFSSIYQQLQKGRRFKHYFEMKGDARHFPIALASMCSKYVREVFMKRFNKYWQVQMPGLKPTAGYYTDAQRFLAETEEFRNAQGIEGRRFIRCR